MPLCLGDVGVGAHEHLAVVGDVAEAGPDLLAVDDVVVAVADGARAQAGEVGAGVGLGEALAPHVRRRCRMPRQVALLLLVGALGDERGAAVEQPDEVHAHVRRTRPLALLDVDEVLGGRGATAAVLLRPVDPRVARLEQLPLPTGVPLAPRDPVVGRGLRRVRRAPRRPATRAARAGTPAPRRCTAGPSPPGGYRLHPEPASKYANS